MYTPTNNNSNSLVKTSTIIFGSLLVLTSLATIISTNSIVKADTSIEDTVTITVDSACTLSGVVPSGSEHTATITPGQNVPNIGITNMTAVCNDASGYDIYAVGYSNDEWKNTNLISEQTVGSTTTTYTIPTGTATSGNNSNWSMKLSTGTGDAATIITSPTDYSNFANVPNDYTKVATYPSSTTGSSGSSFTTTYQVFASTSQTAGTYVGKVKYTLVHPHANDASNKPIAASYIQDLTLSQCQAQATDAPLTVVDRRDGSDYTVRYIDGVCWMTQNLRITGVISATDSNFEGNNFNTMAAGDLKDNESTQAEPQSHLANSSDVSVAPSGYTITMLGAWYNYCAASAGEICQSQIQPDATQDICPAGWSLPNYNTISNIAGSATTIDTNANIFSPIYGGFFFNGSFTSAANRGNWWSSSTSNSNGMHKYIYLDQNGNLTASQTYRSYGNYIRCVRTT